MQIKTFMGRGLLASLLATSLIACSAPVVNQTPTSTTQAIASTPLASTSATAAPTIGLTDNTLGEGVTGIGRVAAAQDADLVFTVQGTVEKVLVEEGDEVQAGQVLATLDVRPFEQQIQQAEAALRTARAQRSALLEGPKSADIRAANA